ncbi:hypothetical protein [Sulfuracidifex tepidarius]|uniref:hypothetical protein n=1 Tax=Sulfuracidifex tepidarius TaxID=1294262 RepID=UPI0006D036D6|nr:hypothetical protein [Sulfuracidifex tepidarius]
MIIGIGRGPLADFITGYYSEYVGEIIFPYPGFYDDKKLLLSSKLGYIPYLKKLVKLHNYVRIALWPDYIKPKVAAKIVKLDLLRNIVFVVPVHSLNDIEIGEELESQGFGVFYGYASDEKYRDYSLSEFLTVIKGDKWYLGVSSKRELKEALVNNFNGLDVTGYLFGRNEDRKDPKKLQKMLTELLRIISKPQVGSSHSTISRVNWGV